MHKQGSHFYGTATVGEKGQVVIPAEAREKMGIEKGEKLLAFGMGDDMIVLTKLANMEKFAQHLAGQLEHIRKAINSSKK